MSQISTETLDMDNLICDLKATVTALECQQKMELNKNQIPVEVRNLDCNQKCKRKSESRTMIPSVPSGHKKNKEKNRTKKKRKEKEDECAFVSPEMRAGVLYTKCECVFRNGLQDDCPLTLCQGQPDCLIKPWPECPPGKYFRTRQHYISSQISNALSL
ncbi:uncharacterized protein LOC117180144 [Belonocnema kinseyi]|uniref:uncharacterized protein LOC117180144 n=1 Tax=Belonocnema kinseyi TaxID=2817044 RepID=UPI00143DDCAB|nr:uncharacterized protein LOC117180144 [Belonocnema kinseyi]